MKFITFNTTKHLWEYASDGGNCKKVYRIETTGLIESVVYITTK